MLECFAVNSSPVSTKTTAETTLTVKLVYEQRQKSRAKAVMDNGEEVAWFLPRGRVLADGDCLLTHSGEQIKVVAADECVSEVQSADSFLLMRAAYHLGNRHVPLQIGFDSANNKMPSKNSTGVGFLRYQHDHVLDDMVRGLGLTLNVEQKPFHPESGAYHNDSVHSHTHQHEHDHGHSHSHHHD